MAKFEAYVELSCMQSIQWYPIAFRYWKLSHMRSHVGQKLHCQRNES